MFSQIDILIKNLEQKEKIIKYINTIYKIETGTEAIIPDPYIYNEDICEREENLDSNKIFHSFQEKVDSLNLPTVLDKNLKEKIHKLKKSHDTKFLIKHLNLSNYADKGFDLILFKRVTGGMKILRSIEDLNLRNNNMNDEYADNICELFNLENLKRIDISYNNFTVHSAKKFINVLKFIDKLEYLDVSYNPFNSDYYSCSNICNSMRHHVNLYHYGISDCSRDTAIKVLCNHPDLRSLNLDDNKYSSKSYDYLSKYLINKKYQLSVLSLKYSTVDVISASYIQKSLMINKSLVYINLYSTSLSDNGAARIISAMEYNKTLVDLDLGANYLGEEFCKKFGRMLKVNNTLVKLNLTKNYLLIDKNFSVILDGLVHNQTVTSLGDLFDTKIGVKMRESVGMILNMNKEFIENQVLVGYEKNVNVENSKINEFNKSQKINVMKNTYQNENYKTEGLDYESKKINCKNDLELDEAEKKIMSRYDINFEEFKDQ